MTRKAVLITEIIAPYRIPVFNALAQSVDIDLHVVFLAETDKALRQWRIYADEIRFSYEVLPSRRLRIGKRNLLINRCLRAALESAKPEAVICGGYNYPASWQALWWARHHKARFALWTESNQYDKRSGLAPVEWLKRYFVRSCDAFVVPGKSSSAYLHALGVADNLIFTAPNAVNNAFFATHAQRAREQAVEFRRRLKLPLRFILYVGRLVPEKGIFDLLQAYARLEGGLRSEVSLVFAGDGKCREELMQRAKRVNPGTVFIPGFAHREELAGLYALADMLVFPTHSDPWGLVVNEAMACALPVVVTDIAGCTADLVEQAWNGYVFPAGDVEKMSLAMDSLLRHPDLRRQMSAHSSERIRHYSPEICAAGLASAITGAHCNR